MKPFFSSSKLRALSVLAVHLLLLSPSHAILDQNFNNLSDVWEKQYNQGELFPETFYGAADPDQDGWDNLTEAAAGTDPFSSNSPNGIIKITLTPSLTLGAYTLTWPTVVGKAYQMESSVNLKNWSKLGDPIVATSTEHSIGINATQPDSSVPPKLFWRITISDVDDDSDSLTNAEEYIIGTNSQKADTDGDRVLDFDEIVKTFTNPILALDTDNDGMAQDFEIYYSQQLLATFPDPAHWNYTYDDLLAGNLDPDTDYTGEGLTMADLYMLIENQTAGPDPAALFIQPEIRSNSLKWAYYIAPVGNYPAEEPGLYWFSKPNTFGEPVELNSSADYTPAYLSSHIPDVEWERLIVGEYYVAACDSYSTMHFTQANSSFRTNPNYAPGVTRYNGSINQKRFRFVTFKLQEEDLKKSFIKVTYRRPYDTPRGSPGEVLLNMEPFEVVIPKGKHLTGWTTFDAPILDGFLTETFLFPVEIQVKETLTGAVPANGLCVQKDNSITFDLTGGLPSEMTPMPNGLVKWQTRQIKQDGTFTPWSDQGHGLEKVNSTWVAGIFQLRAVVTMSNAQEHEYQFIRLKDCKYARNADNVIQDIHKKDAADYFGITDHWWQRDVQINASQMLGSVLYAKAARTPINSLSFDIPFRENDPNTFNPKSDKCNLFVYHKINDAVYPSKKIGMVRNGNPPMAIDWWNDNSGILDSEGREINTVDIPMWHKSPNTEYPQPGWVASRADLDKDPDSYHAHCGILDYDGSWISAGPISVNKYCHILTSAYQPLSLKK